MLYNRFRLFKKLDHTKDGQLHFEEFQAALHAYAIRVELSIEKQLFQEIDLDGTGYISYDEFLIALRVSTPHNTYLFSKYMMMVLGGSYFHISW